MNVISLLVIIFIFISLSYLKIILSTLFQDYF